jgi:hypothetical protein
MDLQQQAAILYAKTRWQSITEKAQATNSHPNDYNLRLALEDAAHSIDLLPEVEAELDSIIASVSPEKREFLEYQRWLAGIQLERASSHAVERREYLRTIRTSNDQKRELELCRTDIKHWFNNWAWTADPRPDSPLYTVPFILFRFQEEGIDWLENLVFRLRSDGLIDKARDTGVSWLMVAWAVYHWLFGTRQNPFLALFGSRKEELVDKLGDMSTLFEKMRFVIRLIPSWMLPDGFSDDHMGYLRIVNPETGSMLTGESSNPNFGRAGRYTAIIFDEHAAFPDGGYMAWTASSQSSKSKISVSTPQGRLTKQAQLRYTDGFPRKSFKWQQHPFKDERWYKGQKASMTDVEIAQELDISYDASQAGRVYPHFSELYHVITWKEFARVYPDAIVRDSTGKIARYRIPPSWSLGRGQDWGSTESHPCITLWMARAKEGAKYAGSVFVYREFIAPTGSTPNMVARAIKELEREDSEGDRMALSVMSHEAKSERDTYNMEAHLPFSAWTTDTAGGIAQVNNYLEIVDTTLPNPFVPELQGRPRLYIIVDDEEGVLKYDFESSTHWRLGAQSSKGLVRLRSEFPVYHYPESEEGKAVQRLKPFKRFDDAMDVLRCMASEWFPAIRPETQEEKIVRLLPKELTMEEICKLPQDQQASAFHARQFRISDLKRQHPPAMNWRKKAKYKREHKHRYA